jgi:hypothetical protein
VPKIAKVLGLSVGLGLYPIPKPRFFKGVYVCPEINFYLSPKTDKK